MKADLIFTIEGHILPYRRDLFVNGKLLDIEVSRKFINHSQEFAWGYMGSGPSQSALGVLLAAGINFADCAYIYHDFKEKVIARIFIDKQFKATVYLVIEGTTIVHCHFTVVEVEEDAQSQTLRFRNAGPEPVTDEQLGQKQPSMIYREYKGYLFQIDRAFKIDDDIYYNDRYKECIL